MDVMNKAIEQRAGRTIGPEHAGPFVEWLVRCDAIPSLNKTLVLELAQSEYATLRENVIAVGNSGTGKTQSLSGSVSRPARKGYPSTRVSLKRRDEFRGGLMASAYANVHAPLAAASQFGTPRPPRHPFQQWVVLGGDPVSKAERG